MTITLPTYRRPEPERDRWQRYLLPDLDGKKVPWQRVTTFADLIKNMHSLIPWKIRTPVIGLIARPELFASFVALPDPNGADKGKADKILEEAHKAGGGDEGRDLGSALHTFTEQHDSGEPLTLPPPWDGDLKAYIDALTTAAVEIRRDWIERIVILDDLHVAGTLDRIVTIDGVNYIADLKTGKDPAAFPHDICIQLACYANADCMYDVALEQRVPMPDVNKDRALVIHLPPGTGKCHLWWFDIRQGWAMVDVVAAVRDWRATGDLVSRVDPQPQLPLQSGSNIPPLPATPTPPFHVDEGDLLDPATSIAKLTAGFTGLGLRDGTPAMIRWAGWLRDADRAGRPFRYARLDDNGNVVPGTEQNATRRRSRIYGAGARLLVQADNDDEALIVINAVLNTDYPTIGQALGELDLPGAARLTEALVGILRGTTAIAFGPDGRPYLTNTKT